MSPDALSYLPNPQGTDASHGHPPTALEHLKAHQIQLKTHSDPKTFYSGHAQNHNSQTFGGQPQNDAVTVNPWQAASPTASPTGLAAFGGFAETSAVSQVHDVANPTPCSGDHSQTFGGQPQSNAVTINPWQAAPQTAAPTGLAAAFGGFAETSAVSQVHDVANPTPCPGGQTDIAQASWNGGTSSHTAHGAFGPATHPQEGNTQAWMRRPGHEAQVMHSAHSCLTNKPSYTITQDGKHIYRHDPDGSKHDVGYMLGNVYKNQSINALTYLKDGKLYDYRTDDYLGKWVGGIMFDRHGVEIGRADTAAEFGAYVTFGVRGGIG